MPDQDYHSFAVQSDQSDVLAEFKSNYLVPLHKPGQPTIYCCGNSLGLQHKDTRMDVNKELDRWADLGVKGHFEGDPPWFSYQDELVSTLTDLVGARQGEVTIMNTLTVNIHLMLVSFYRPFKDRYKIMVEYSPFPSDLYAVKSQIRAHGYSVEEALIELKPRVGEFTLRLEDIEEAIRAHGEQLALIYFGSVNYLSGQVVNIPAMVDLAHQTGAYFGLDLAHGAGNLLLNLHEWQVDFAIWCNYKYLNGGPNCLAGCFIHQRHHSNTGLVRFEGWWGHDKNRRFLMEPDFVPLPGAEAWQLSGPPVLSMAAMKAPLVDFKRAGMVQLRNKSILLTGFLQTLIELIDDPRLSIITPNDPESRGCQLSILLQAPDKKIYYQILASGIVVDWREPGIIRIAPAPMYNTFGEMYLLYTRIAHILKSQ